MPITDSMAALRLCRSNHEPTHALRLGCKARRTWSGAMLAEIFMLRLEAALRDAVGQATPSDTRFVPVEFAVSDRRDLKLSPASNGRA